MTKAAFSQLMQEVKGLFQTDSRLCDFNAYPNDCEWQEVAPFLIPATDLFLRDLGFDPKDYPGLQSSLRAVANSARWRETYKGTNIGEDFLKRFGCFEIFGREGHYHSEKMRGFFVYSDADLYYPWHHHPAEELYLIISGSAVFEREGRPSEVLRAGDTVYHMTNQPHNMLTRNEGVLALVFWRGEMTIPPVLTDRLNQ